MGLINSIGAWFEKLVDGFTFGTQTHKITVKGTVEIEGGVGNYEHVFPNKNGTVALTNDIDPRLSDVEQIIYSNTSLAGQAFVIWSGTGLVFDVIYPAYYLGGVRYNSGSTQITLNPADVTHPRLDVIALDATGPIKITGTPSADPVQPTADTATEIAIATILVNANATSPANTTLQNVYNENAEWAGSSGIAGTVFNATVAPYQGALHVDVAAHGGRNNTIQFVDNAINDIASFNTIRFRIRLKAALAPNATLGIMLYNGATGISSMITLGLVHNFNSSLANVYQFISIPFSSFTFSNSGFDTVMFVTNGNHAGFYLDEIALISASSTVSGATNSLKSIITDNGIANADQPGDMFEFRGAGGATVSAVGKVITITAGGGGGWQVTGTTNLTGDVLIAGDFNKFFTGTGGFVVGHNALTTPGTRFQVRGTDDVGTPLFLGENFAGNEVFKILNNGTINSIARTGAALAHEFRSNSNTLFFDITGDLGADYHLRLGVLSGTPYIASFNGIINAGSHFNHNAAIGNGGGVTTINIGSKVSSVINITDASTPKLVGFEYNPTITNLGSASNYAFRSSSGNHGFGTLTPTAKVDIKGDGTTTGIALKVSDSNNVERFTILDNGSIGVNAASISLSSVFQIDSTTKGFLPPRMTTAQRDAIGTPATGLVIYNTTTLTLNHYNGTIWSAIGGADLSRRSYFRFNSNLFTEQALSFRGITSSFTSYFTGELSAISYEVRTDVATSWTAQADLTALQTWINTNITGTEASGTLYWIKVLVTYGSGKTGEAEVRLTYNAS